METMSATITETLTLETETCCNCGTVFAMSASLRASRKNDGELFYCPNGHPQHYTRTTAQKLQEQLDAKVRELTAAKCEALRVQQLREIEQKQREALEKKLRRVQKGVCPCCKRCFQNLGRHMATKHPEAEKSITK
jgi:hypothetical protein